MAGKGLSVAEIQRWNAAAVREVFHAAGERGRAAFDASAGLGALGVFDSWGGDTATAAATSIHQTRMDLDAHGGEAMAVAHAAWTAAEEIERVQGRLAELIADAERHALAVDPVSSTVEFTDRISEPLDALIAFLELQPRLRDILVAADFIDDTLAAAIDMADGDAPIPVIPGPPERAESRLGNQIDAFREVLHRPPCSAADWVTAAELDPHSYEPKNHEVPPHVVVGRIKPVPGQGVLRASLFIPSASVKDPTFTSWPPFDDNAGDNRGFDPAAGPESARVSVDIDYENGLIVVRQNPSVNLSTGQVRAGTPTVRAAQRPDGSVYLDYAAADPFSPGGEGLAKQTICVQGQIVVQPGVEAPRIGGTVTSFPALEVYHDRAVPGGPTITSTVTRMWPDNTGEWGPLLGLPFTEDVGDPQVFSDFLAPDAPVPLDPTATTELGPTAKPPAVVLLE